MPTARPHRMLPADELDPDDIEAISQQLGRVPRGVIRVAHRCPCGRPDVVQTAPRLPEGTPFPTVYYLTCPRASSAIGTLESSGLMRRMEARLADDPDLAERYRRAHDEYVATRTGIEDVPEIRGISAGGMPDRVKCLHVLVAHSLAVGPGVNPLGDEALAALGDWWRPTMCHPESA
jgi:hypothetical protein